MSSPVHSTTTRARVSAPIKKLETYDSEVLRSLLMRTSKGVIFVRGSSGAQPTRLDFTKYIGHDLLCDGRAHVRYVQTSGVGIGRYYCERLSLQSMPRELRRHLAHKYYHDVDMKNALPVLLQQLCQKHCIDTPRLDAYTRDRDHYLEQIQKLTTPSCSYDAAKKLFNTVQNGGTLTTWMKEQKTRHPAFSFQPGEVLEFVQEYTSEMRRVAAHIFALPEYQPLRNDIRKKDSNPTTRFLSILLQDIENDCLQVVHDTLQAADWSMDSLMFDGGLVRRREGLELDDEILRACEAAVRQSTGYSITLVVKSLTPELPLDSLVVEEPEPPTTDLAAAQLLHELEGDNWRSVSNGSTVLFVYNEETGLWTQREEVFLQLITRHSERFGKRYGEMRKQMCDVMKLCHGFNIVDTSWTLQLDRLRDGLVPFCDGIYDVRTQKTRPFTRDDMLTTKFDFAAPLDESHDTERAELRRILGNLLPETALRFEVMKRAAESFFSCTNTHKYFVQLYGEGDNGKTTLLRICCRRRSRSGSRCRASSTSCAARHATLALRSRGSSM